jgi:hypothetical protein
MVSSRVVLVEATPIQASPFHMHIESVAQDFSYVIVIVADAISQFAPCIFFCSSKGGKKGRRKEEKAS